MRLSRVQPQPKPSAPLPHCNTANWSADALTSMDNYPIVRASSHLHSRFVNQGDTAVLPDNMYHTSSLCSWGGREGDGRGGEGKGGPAKSSAGRDIIPPLACPGSNPLMSPPEFVVSDTLPRGINPRGSLNKCRRNLGPAAVKGWSSSGSALRLLSRFAELTSPRQCPSHPCGTIFSYTCICNLFISVNTTEGSCPPNTTT